MTAFNSHSISDPGSPARIALIVEARYLQQTQPSGLREALRARNQTVEVITPETSAYTMGDDHWLEGLDLIVGRGRSVSLQFLLCWAESKGIPTINCREAISAVFNKAEMAIALASGRVPTPATFFGPIADLVECVPESCYPLILKPVFGDNCRDLRIVHSVSELSLTEWPEPAALAQHFMPSDGFDLKLYGIGRDVWAVRKPSCLAKAGVYTFTGAEAESAHPVPLTRAMEELALRCADIFGLELYGVDCVETPEGPLVIEVNDFPNYTAVAGADEKLADFVLSRALKEKGNG